MRLVHFVAILLIVVPCFAAGQNDEYRWWPVQAKPQSIIRTSCNFIDADVDIYNLTAVEKAKMGPVHMMMQSVAGLAALAVNEGRGDELVWVDHYPTETHHDDYQMWLQRVQDQLNIRVTAKLKPWELVTYFKAQGIIKGYILYSFDRVEGMYPSVRPGMNVSANIATMICPFEQGIVISEELEPQAQRLGLKRLCDARDKDAPYVLERYGKGMNRKWALAQDPRLPYQRALAIANKTPVLFGMEEPTPTIYAWLEPTAYIMGYNAPDEGKFIKQLSVYGHVLLASNWAMNLPVLAAASDDYSVESFKSVDPTTIDYSGDAVSFLMSDGDNVQWLLGDFCTHPYYWGGKDHGSYPIGWGVPLACLAQVAPTVLDYLVQTQPAISGITLQGGGYYFPDSFGLDLSPAQRQALLREHARKMGHYMTRYGCNTLSFICMDIESPEAHGAYKIFAEEIDGLLAMFAMQYAPYEAGDGKVLWTKDQQGYKVPIITCKYGVWAHLNNPKTGTPAKIARIVKEDAAQSDPLLAWAVIHAWSGFKKIEGDDEFAENGQFLAPDSTAGVTPTQWCVDRLGKNIKVVTPEELAWRVRMQYEPEQTKELLKKYRSR